MARQLEAVYEHGVLRPLEPLSLREHQHVRLTLEEPLSEGELAEENPANLSWKSSDPLNESREEMQWLAKESAQYAGAWVAIKGSLLVAHGPKLADVSAAAKAAGVNDPLFASVPAAPDVPFGGWLAPLDNVSPRSRYPAFLRDGTSRYLGSRSLEIRE